MPATGHQDYDHVSPAGQGILAFDDAHLQKLH